MRHRRTRGARRPNEATSRVARGLAAVLVAVLLAGCGIRSGPARPLAGRLIGVVDRRQISVDPASPTTLLLQQPGNEEVEAELELPARPSRIEVGAGSAGHGALIAMNECTPFGDECEDGEPILLGLDLRDRRLTPVPLPELPGAARFGGFQGDGVRQWVLFYSFVDGVSKLLRFERVGRSWTPIPNPTFPGIDRIGGISSCATGDTLVVLARDMGTGDAHVDQAAARLVGDEWVPLELPVATGRNLKMVCGGGLLGLHDFATEPEVWITPAASPRVWKELGALAPSSVDAGGLPAILSASAVGIVSATPVSTTPPVLVTLDDGRLFVRRVDRGVSTIAPDGTTNVTGVTELVPAFGTNSKKRLVFDNRSVVAVDQLTIVGEAPVD